MKWKTQCVTKLDLHTWQMMLRVFPRITTRTIKQHFMSVVCQTPVMAEYTMRLFPDITAADLVDAADPQVRLTAVDPTGSDEGALRDTGEGRGGRVPPRAPRVSPHPLADP
ncbi:hypothetical protein Pelo_19783 [Pelomyxa schiedti]|nr:hypothetical protein Pelo_19783 [Pelomyxa schiedti]